MSAGGRRRISQVEIDVCKMEWRGALEGVSKTGGLGAGMRYGQLYISRLVNSVHVL